MPPLARTLVVVILATVALAAPQAAEARAPTGPELALLAAVNETRRAHRLPPVKLMWPLQDRAHYWAVRMIRTNYWGHARLPYGVRENLAFGPIRRMTARAVVARWMRSWPHRRAILWRYARRAGFGVARGEYFGYRWMQVSVARFRR